MNSRPATRLFGCKIEGVELLENKIFSDDRGIFLEAVSAGQIPPIVQMNCSISHHNVLRGLHIQRNNPQGKAIFLTHGTVQDVFVDCRKDSPTFGQWDSIILRADDLRMLYLPPGIAHGFYVQSTLATMIYGCTAPFDPASDGGLHWKSLGIDWCDRIDREPIISVKDQQLPGWDEFIASMG